MRVRLPNSAIAKMQVRSPLAVGWVTARAKPNPQLFNVEAIVVLPDHLHCIWTLPAGDADFSTRWRLIKSHFTRHCPEQYKQARSLSRRHKQEQAVWQRRFWEHQIRDEPDFARHVDYIHTNPVSHGLVRAPIEWPYSSFHRFVEQGFYSLDWGKSEEIELIKAWE